MRWLLLMAVGLAAHARCLGNDTKPQPVANPREMLQIMQIDESHLRFFMDDRPVAEDEQEALQKILFRLPGFAQVDVDRWSRSIDEVDSMLRNPDSYRFEMFDLRGETVAIRNIDVVPELVSRLGFRRYYEIVVQHDGVESIVYSRTIPKRWIGPLSRNEPIRETISVQALLLKRGLNAGQHALVFAANRVSWHPRKPSAVLRVSQDEVLLGQLGLDVARLTDVAQTPGIRTKEFRECFYQTLAAVRLAEPEQLARLGKQEFDIARMIQTPDLETGNLFTLKGLARRAILIRVDDPDIRARFHIDHYYEIEVFIPLEKQVRFLDPDGQEDKVFTEYPFVVCVLELPAGMDQGEDIRVPLRFSGFFLKIWAYSTQFMTGDRPQARNARLQQSPLFVGPTVELGRGYEPEKSHLSLIIACVFTASLLAVWLILWRASVQDSLFAKRLFQKHDPADQTFDGLTDLK